MATNLSQFSKIFGVTAKKSGESAAAAMSNFDRPKQFGGYAHILKGTGSPMVDRATEALRGNSAFRTRMLGTKLG
jgi:hypothetical protein